MKYYPYYLIGLARNFRKHQTPSEKILWEKLRNRRLAGLKFVRQFHIGRYIVDFYCRELKIAIKVVYMKHLISKSMMMLALKNSNCKEFKCYGLKMKRFLAT